MEFLLKNIITILSTQVMRIEISIGGLLVDPITNSQNSYHKNCMAVSRENIITNEK